MIEAIYVLVLGVPVFVMYLLWPIPDEKETD